LPDEATPLERRLEVLGRRLAVVALSVAALVAALGLLQGRGWSDVLQLGLALGIAAVPEGLPVVATVALAIGMRRMARRRALVRRLAIVETLGSTTVVCTDKTGTLTTGEMTATTFIADGREIAVTGAGYAPHGVFHELGAPVDPRERPLLNLALRIGVLAEPARHCIAGERRWQPAIPPRSRWQSPRERRWMRGAAPRPAPRRADTVLEQPALPWRSTTRCRRNPHCLMKGGPGRVLSAARSPTKNAAVEETERLARRAWAPFAGAGIWSRDGKRRGIARGLTFVGFVGLTDPPAPGVEDALLELRVVAFAPSC
jgi:Ca2+-transporting ATPase